MTLKRTPKQPIFEDFMYVLGGGTQIEVLLEVALYDHLEKTWTYEDVHMLYSGEVDCSDDFKKLMTQYGKCKISSLGTDLLSCGSGVFDTQLLIFLEPTKKQLKEQLKTNQC